MCDKLVSTKQRHAYLAIFAQHLECMRVMHFSAFHSVITYWLVLIRANSIDTTTNTCMCKCMYIHQNIHDHVNSIMKVITFVCLTKLLSRKKLHSMDMLRASVIIMVSYEDSILMSICLLSCPWSKRTQYIL